MYVCIGMQKSYRQFWNDKTEELCSSNALKNFKPGEIQGAIIVAWSVKKTEILKEELEEIKMEIATQCTGSAQVVILAVHCIVGV